MESYEKILERHKQQLAELDASVSARLEALSEQLAELDERLAEAEHRLSHIRPNLIPYY